MLHYRRGYVVPLVPLRVGKSRHYLVLCFVVCDSTPCPPLPIYTFPYSALTFSRSMDPSWDLGRAGTNSTYFGFLKRAIRVATKSINPCLVRELPAFKTHTALMASPHSGSLTPMTQTSAP